MAAMDAAWYADPLHRFSGRLFDGVEWTDQVSDNGRLHTDPDWPPTLHAVEAAPLPAVETRAAGRGMLIAERRDAGDRRQVNTPRHNLPERRKSDRRQRVIVIPKA